MLVDSYVHLDRYTPDAVDRMLTIEGEPVKVYRLFATKKTGFEEDYNDYNFLGQTHALISVLAYPQRYETDMGTPSLGTHNALIKRGFLQVNDKLVTKDKEYRVLSVQNSHMVQEAILKEL